MDGAARRTTGVSVGVGEDAARSIERGWGAGVAVGFLALLAPAGGWPSIAREAVAALVAFGAVGAGACGRGSFFIPNFFSSVGVVSCRDKLMAVAVASFISIGATRPVITGDHGAWGQQRREWWSHEGGRKRHTTFTWRRKR